MKRFHFSLQSVLSLREQLEQEAERRYAAALAAHEAVLEQIRQLQREFEATWEQQRANYHAGVPVWRAEQLHAYAVLLEERKRQLEAERQKATQAMEKARQQMVQATQQREILDKYRERRRKAYDYAAAQAEQKEMDAWGKRALGLSEFQQENG